jgi:hypothetical protein
MNHGVSRGAGREVADLICSFNSVLGVVNRNYFRYDRLSGHCFAS